MDPNGLLWDKEEQVYYVAQKPELTRIKDSDGDGVADQQETIPIALPTQRITTNSTLVRLRIRWAKIYF